MLKSKKAISLLIKGGYDDELVTQLPKLFISDFFDSEEEKLSEAIDVFIDRIQSDQITPDDNNNVKFAGIIKMEESDMNPESVSGLFYEFDSHVTEEFMHVIKRRPLRNILLEAGAMDYHVKYRYPIFNKEIVGGPEQYQDLCEIRPYVENSGCYIRINDLYNLLLSKGLDEDSISVIFEEYDLGPRYPKTNLNEGVYFNYDAVMKIGNPSYTRIKK